MFIHLSVVAMLWLQTIGLGKSDEFGSYIAVSYCRRLMGPIHCVCGAIQCE